MKQELHQELAKLQNELDKLGTAIGHINNAKQLSESVVENGLQIQQRYKEQVEEVKKVVDQYQQLAGATGELTEEIAKVNFPDRLDKIDNTVSGINQGVQNVIAKLDNSVRDLKEQASSNKKIIYKELHEVEDNLNRKAVSFYILAGIIIVLQLVVIYFHL